MVMVKVWKADVFTPPLFVPPLSTAWMPTVTVAPSLPGVKVRVPFVSTAGTTRKELGLLLVTVNVTNWLLSLTAWVVELVGPAKIFVRALETVTATSYWSAVTEVASRVKKGAWLTQVMVNVKLALLVSVPSSAVTLMVALPLALVRGANKTE